MTTTVDANAETAGDDRGAGRYLARRAEVPQPGSTIGRFVVERVLGQGGEGLVVAARDPLLERHVAIKVLRPGRQLPEDRLLAEGKAIARLRHPNVVTVYDVDVHDDALFIAMELVDGMNLRAWLASATRTTRAVIDCVVAAGRGLAAAHAVGMVHGDFKPENVLVGPGGEVVVTDFGLARLAGDPPGSAPTGDAEVGFTGPAAGTPAYLAPEQWDGAPGDLRADVFAFCVTLHEALHGHRPFEARGAPAATLAELARAVQDGVRVRPGSGRRIPRYIERAIDRGLAADPAARAASMQVLLPELARSSRRWVAPASLAAVAAGASVAIALSMSGDRAARPHAGVCAGVVAIEDAWSGDARARYLSAASDAAVAREHARWLDAYATAWTAARAAVCEDGARDVTAQTVALACLDQARDALRAASTADSATWPRLPALEACTAGPLEVRAQTPTIPVGAQSELALAPDGKTAALSNKGGDAVVFELDAAYQPRPLPGVWVALGWLDDGRLEALTRDLRLQLVATDGATTELDRVPGFVPHASRMAPDGSAYTIESDDGLEVRAHPGGAVITRLAGVADAVWSPDSQRVAGTTVDGNIVVFDRRRQGQPSRITVRTGVGAFGVRGLVWLSRERLALNGEFGAGQLSALWTLEVDDAGGLAGHPALVLAPTDDFFYHPVDARNGRLLLKRHSAHTRMFALRDGVRDDLPAVFNDADVLGVDHVRGRVLARRVNETFAFAVGDDEPVPAPRVSVHREPTASERRALGPDAFDAAVSCSGHEVDRCLVHGWRGSVLVVAPLAAGGAGPAHELAGASGPPAINRDGRVLAPRWDGTLIELDPASGALGRPRQVAGPQCSAMRAGWLHDQRGAWAVIACPDRFALVRHTAAGAEELVQSEGWISGVASLAGDVFVYSVLDLDPRLFVVDGLVGGAPGIK